MLHNVVSATALSLLAILSDISQPYAAAQSQDSCKDYVIMSIRGTFEKQGPSAAFKQMINTTLSTVPNGIEYDVVYPAAQNQTAWFGADDAQRYINSGLTACPNQKYVFVGWSQGASATAYTLGNYTDPAGAAYKAIKAVFLVGNPYHHANRSINVDQNGGNTTKAYDGALTIGYNTTFGIPDVWYNNGKVIDVCYEGDIICAPYWPGANLSYHLLYSNNSVTQAMGARFLINGLQGLAPNASLTSNSTTSTTASPTMSQTSSAGTATSASTSQALGSVIAPNSVIVAFLGAVAIIGFGA